MNTIASKQAVGPRYKVASMLHARDMTWRAVEQIAAVVEPGMRESEALSRGRKILEGLGMERLWHPMLVRIGANTLKKFNQPSEADPQLADNDIFFVDLGVVWDGHEGDSGATFVVGNDAELHAAAAAVKTLYDAVESHWRTTGAAGIELYDDARRRAEEAGWHLNLDIKGHRVSDFPHAIHRGGDLGDYSAQPAPGLWILEIQIAHSSRPFGAFYEDLLI